VVREFGLEQKQLTGNWNKAISDIAALLHSISRGLIVDASSAAESMHGESHALSLARNFRDRTAFSSGL
jgi:hypothetical protein